MKKSILVSFLICIFCAFFPACDNDDDDLKLTKDNGRPSSVERGDEKTFFYYEGNRLKKIKEIKGSVSDYMYENGKLVSVSHSPEDKRVADGHGSVWFKQTDNRVHIGSSGEPGFEEFQWEIELDDSGLPQRITELGIYSRNNEKGELSLIKEGDYSTELTYDPVKKNLIKMEKFVKKSDELLMSYSFEYDDNPGIMSKVDLPLWYYAYQMYRGGDNRDGYNRFFCFYCHFNNIVKERITGEFAEGVAITEDLSIYYTYEYNKKGYPVSLGAGYYTGLPYFKITY
jgi:hypothetical protein